jgi:hypothetical protein
MVRARMAGVALAAALGLACGCSTPSSCSSCSSSSFTSRLTGLFRRNSPPTDVVGSPIEGPVISDPGPGPAPCESSGFPPMPQTFSPPLAPPPLPLNEAQRMPYQP